MTPVLISSLNFDIDGYIAIDALPDSDFGATTRRVNKVKTIDGGAVINDGGHSYGDRDFYIIWKATDEDFELKAKALVRNHSLVHVSNDEGCFLAAPDSHDTNEEGESTLVLLIKEKVSQ